MTQSKAQRQWQAVCKKVAAEVGVAVEFYQDPAPRLKHIDAFEDDGCLHVTPAHGLRACFDVGNGQSFSGAEQNMHTRSIIHDLNLENLITDRVLVDEDMDKEDDDYCSHCGRGL